MGGLIFIDLRDRYGVTQVTLDPVIVGQKLVSQAASYNNEYVLKVTGEVILRPDTMKNPDMVT